MIEFWLVISTTCFNALHIQYSGDWGNPFYARTACFDQVYIYDSKPALKEQKNVFVLVAPEKWRRALRYCGDDRKPKEYAIDELGFVANDYALGTYQKHYGELPTSTQIKILEKISSDTENSQKIQMEAAKLLWRLRIKIEEDLITIGGEK